MPRAVRLKRRRAALYTVGKVGQFFFGLHTSVQDLGATGIQFGFCADSSGLFAGTQVGLGRTVALLYCSTHFVPEPLT